MRKFTLAASAAVLAMTAAVGYMAVPAIAQSSGDGTMTWADAKTKADAMWVKLDVNKDGKLDQGDRDAKTTQMFDKIDTNHDGSISKDEFVTHHRTMMDGKGMDDKGGKPPMAGMDHDGPDGMEHGGMGGPSGRQPRGHGMGGGMGHGGPMAMLMMADTNKDGTITRAEYDAAVKAHFDKADANHDGKITRDERRAAWQSMRGRDGETMKGMGGMAPPPPSDDGA